MKQRFDHNEFEIKTILLTPQLLYLSLSHRLPMAHIFLDQILSDLTSRLR
jgi:hypothetical protein